MVVILFILHSINSLAWRALLEYMIQSGKPVLLCRVLELCYASLHLVLFLVESSCHHKYFHFSYDSLKTKLI